MDYASQYQYSLTDPAGFWRDQAQALPWKTAPQTVLSKDENGVARWFADG